MRQLPSVSDFFILIGAGTFVGASLAQWQGLSFTTSFAVGLIIVGVVWRFLAGGPFGAARK